MASEATEILTNLNGSLAFKMESLVRPTKKHRTVKAGVKAMKKDEKSKKKRGLGNERYNPKAFSVSSIGKTKRCDQRNLDRMQRKETVERTNRTEEELPPPVCAVVMVCLKKSFALAFFSSKFQSCLIVFANDTIFFIKTLC